MQDHRQYLVDSGHLCIRRQDQAMLQIEFGVEFIGGRMLAQANEWISDDLSQMYRIFCQKIVLSVADQDIRGL